MTDSCNIQAGGVFVDRAATSLLQDKLKSSRYGTDEIIEEMVQEFEKKVRFISFLFLRLISCHRLRDFSTALSPLV